MSAVVANAPKPIGPSADQLKRLIEASKGSFDLEERSDFERARRYYRGDFFKGMKDVATDSTPMMLCSKNIIYAIADSAISGLLGPNPQVAAVPRSQAAADKLPEANGLLEYVFDANRMRRRASIALTDAVLCKRGIFKTTWDPIKDIPKISVVDPGRLFFDLSVRDVDDIRYWLEATVIPFGEFQARVAKGLYDAKAARSVQPNNYPRWLADTGQLDEQLKTMNTTKWVTVWEYYDRVDRAVVHYVDGGNVVMRDKMVYSPYSMFSLNHNGVDCRGLSEVQLVLDQQRTINDLLSHWKKITYLQIPRILFNAGLLTNAELDKAVNAATGAFVPVNLQDPEALRALREVFFQLPMPETPEGVIQFIQREEDDAAFISALAEMARGRMTGAKTATEVAVVEAQMRNRLSTREGHFNGAVEDVAGKCFFLCQQYMQKEKMIQLAGAQTWNAVSLDGISDIEVDFKMVAYNPIKQNPAVMAESIIQLAPLMLADENVDRRAIMESLVEAMGLPRKTIKDLTVVEEEKAAAEGMALQASLGGAAAAMPMGPPEEMLAGPPAEGDVVPLPEGPAAFPGGGGSPGRDVVE